MADKYAILQLKRTDETAQERFMCLEWLESRGMKPEPSHYDLIYSGEMEQNTTLEGLYVKFNTVMVPGFTGHSMSVSDIVVFMRPKQWESDAYYCDSRGFKPLPTFHHPEVEALMKMEADKANV